MLMVDNRWTGKHGIGRYADEILPRLGVDWTPIRSSGTPSSATDFLLKRLRVDGKVPCAIYSPGYNGFLRRVPQTVTVLDLIHLHSPGASKYRAYYNQFLRPLIRRNGHVLTISETSRSHIQEWLRDDSVEVVNAGIGVSSGFVAEGDAHKAARPYFVYVGNLRHHKNVETIVAALARLRDVDLVMVVADTEGVRTLAQRHGVNDRIHTVSGINDVQLARLYRGARATLQPSLVEGFGLPALESMLCGTPVIYAAQCESVAEVCGSAGTAVEHATDSSMWADAMKSIDDADGMSDTSAVAARYSWDTTAGIITEVLQQRHPQA